MNDLTVGQIVLSKWPVSCQHKQHGA